MMRVCLDDLSLTLPNDSHQAEYCRIMDAWEAVEEVQPHLMRRYSARIGGNVPYAQWLAWCEDDRTTGSMLADNVPCSLYFLVNSQGEIFGSMAINHRNTHRGHLHAGIVPWHRGKGYGTAMLALALERCREMGIHRVEIAPRQGNRSAIQTILRNGGTLMEEFFDDDGILILRYAIDLRAMEI